MEDVAKGFWRANCLVLLNIVPTKKWSKEWSYIIAVLRLTKKYCKIVLNDIAKICREITKKKLSKVKFEKTAIHYFGIWTKS